MIALALLAIVLLCASLLYKLRRVHLMLFQLRDMTGHDGNALFRQLEALQALYVGLGLRKALPATRGWAASPDFLRELMLHALEQAPRCVVECSSGTSTVVLARCMQLLGQGRVYSLEHDPVYAQRTRALLAQHELTDWAVVLDAPLVAQAGTPWYDLAGLPGGLAIDMLVIDGPPQATAQQARYPAGPALFPRLTPQAAVFLDDADRPGERAALARWSAEFPDLDWDFLPCEKGAVKIRHRVAA